VSRVSREAPVLILKYDATQIVAGGAGNAANNVAALGSRVRLAGLVGADPEGRRLLASFHRGVDKAQVVRAKQYRTPVKIVSLNNRYLGMVRQWQQIDYGGRYSHSYMDALPDFVKLAEAYGHVGIRIDKPSEVEPALKKMLALKDRTVFLDVRTDQTENVWPMVQAGKGITEMLLGSEDL